MPSMPPMHRPHGWQPPREKAKEEDQRRGSARERGYTTAWDRASASRLTRHPLCEYCEAGAFGEPCITPATLTDHLIPHRGDQVIFWNRAHWVSSCKPCHDGPKQAVERVGGSALARLVALMRPGEGGSKV